MACGICVADLAIFVLGLVVLITGRIKLTSSRGIEGGMARVIGVTLMLSLIAGPGSAGVYGGVIGATEGMKMARGKQQINDADKQALAERIQQRIEGPATIIRLVGSGVPLVIAVILTIVCAGPLKSKRLRDDREDDYEDEDRPRSSREDDEDRPRRRSREDVDDDLGDRGIKSAE